MAIVQAANAHMFIYFSSTVHPRHGTGAQPKRRSQAEAALLVRTTTSADHTFLIVISFSAPWHRQAREAFERSEAGPRS